MKERPRQVAKMCLSKPEIMTLTVPHAKPAKKIPKNFTIPRPILIFFYNRRYKLEHSSNQKISREEKISHIEQNDTNFCTVEDTKTGSCRSLPHIQYYKTSYTQTWLHIKQTAWTL
jgi:hypothetical protein